jgi:hypothetical protein
MMINIQKYQSLQKYPDLSRIIIVLSHWGQIPSMTLLGTEVVSNDCLSSTDTLWEGNSKPQLSHFIIEGIKLL